MMLLGIFIYRHRFSLRAPQLKNRFDLLIAALSGFVIMLLIRVSAISTPFPFMNNELFFMMVFYAPIVEELIFRFYLWESLYEFDFRSERLNWAITLMFSFAHFAPFIFFPSMRGFILVQCLYVIPLGLACGYKRLKSNNMIEPILVHFFFNAGFFIAGRLL